MDLPVDSRFLFPLRRSDYPQSVRYLPNESEEAGGGAVGSYFIGGLLHSC